MAADRVEVRNLYAPPRVGGDLTVTGWAMPSTGVCPDCMRLVPIVRRRGLMEMTMGLAVSPARWRAVRHAPRGDAFASVLGNGWRRCTRDGSWPRTRIICPGSGEPVAEALPLLDRRGRQA